MNTITKSVLLGKAEIGDFYSPIDKQYVSGFQVVVDDSRGNISVEVLECTDNLDNL